MIDFSGISDSTLVGMILRWPLRLVPRNLTMPIWQGELRGKKWIAGSSNHGCWLGSYECDKQTLIARSVEQGTVFFDIGAHVGFYTLLASILVGDAGKVFAFEPLPRNLEYLKKHLDVNGIQNVTIFDAAVSNRSGKAQFAEAPNSSMGSLVDEGMLTVDVVSLDELLASERVPHPHYMKIDVEGAEMSVLEGASTLLAEACPTIFLATHGRKVHAQCISLLQSLGYICRPLDETKKLDDCDEIIAAKSVE